MTPLQAALLAGANVLIVATLGGLVVRGRLGRLWLFAPYLMVVLIASTLIGLWPSRFLVWGFWLGKELAAALLKFGIAIELSYRVFAALPRAAVTARRALLVVLTITAWAALTAPLPSQAAADVARVAMARIGYGTAWLFAGLLAIVAWYRVPMDPLHKTVLAGFVPYLLIFTVGLGLLETYGWGVHALASYGMSAAYVAVLALWTWAAWRQETPPPRGPAVERLQPWR